MSNLDYRETYTPSGWHKLLYFNWSIFLLILAVAALGFLMLISVSGGDINLWAMIQIKRFGISVVLMLCIAFIPITFWLRFAPLAYIGALALIVSVEIFGVQAMGAKRWIDLGFIRLQPSEFMKIGIILMLAAFYNWIGVKRQSHPIWVVFAAFLILLPVLLVMRQPDLGTAILLLLVGAGVVFLAGVYWIYFVGVLCCGVGALAATFFSKGTPWQMLKDYQYKRIETFFSPESDPLGAGYHIAQSKIAFGAGGWTGRGFMQGTQNQLNFLPEKHTDFIFTTLAEEFGFIGTVALIGIYGAIVLLGTFAGLSTSERFSRLLILGVCLNFFLYFATNTLMVIGLIPVVGVPLPLISYGGSSMLVIMIGFGLLQSAYIHRVRYK